MEGLREKNSAMEDAKPSGSPGNSHKQPTLDTAYLAPLWLPYGGWRRVGHTQHMSEPPTQLALPHVAR